MLSLKTACNDNDKRLVEKVDQICRIL